MCTKRLLMGPLIVVLALGLMPAAKAQEGKAAPYCLQCSLLALRQFCC